MFKKQKLFLLEEVAVFSKTMYKEVGNTSVLGVRMFKIKGEEETIQLWVLLGPFFLLLSLFVSSFMPIIANRDLWVLSLVGIALCWKFKMRGMGFALLALLAFICIKHFQIPNHHLWQFGLELSVAFGLLITTFSLDRSNFFFFQLKDEKKQMQNNIQKINEVMEREKDFHERQNKSLREELEQHFWKLEEKNEKLESIHNLIDSLKQQNDDYAEDRENLLLQISRYKDHILQKEEEKKSLLQKIEKMNDEQTLLIDNQSLLEKLNSIRKEQKQNQLINETLSMHVANETKKCEELLSQKTLLEQKLKALEKQNKEANKVQMANTKSNNQNDNPKDFLENKKIQSLYQQLKKQFNEKDQQLHKTRSQLFKIQEKLLVIKHQEKLSLGHMPLHEQQLAKRLSEAEKEYLLLEQENQLLIDFVSSIVSVT